MEKKRQFDQLNNFHHPPSGRQNQHQGSGGGGIKKRSSESNQFRQLNGSHFASNGNAATTAMHASNGGPPSSTCSRSFSVNDDNHCHASVSEVVEFKFKTCSGENETPLFAVATEIQELFGVDNLTFAPDLNSAHSTVFVAVCVGTGSAHYTSDMLNLSSTEEVIQEFLNFNLFD